MTQACTVGALLSPLSDPQYRREENPVLLQGSCHCQRRTGKRTIYTQKALREMGFSRVYNLPGDRVCRPEDLIEFLKTSL
jgi:hypothetical protein